MKSGLFASIVRVPLELAPRAAIGMTVGPEIAEPEPTPIVTMTVRTKVHGGVDLTGPPVRCGHGVRWYRRRRLGRRGISLTQSTTRLVRQALEGLRLIGAEARRFEELGLLSWHGWRRHRARGPGEV